MHNNQKIPEGWSVKKLEDCFSFLKTPSYSRTETTDSGEVRYIHYGDIHTKYHLHVCPTDIDIFVSAEQARKGDLLKTGDLILLDASEDYEGTTKCIELVDIKENDKVISGLHTLALRDNTKNFANGFRAYITSIPFVKDLFWKQVSGFKVYGVSKDNLKKLKLIFPPLAEQKKIAEILGTWDEAIEKLSSLIEQKKLLKKGLMQKLLTGKVRLPGFTQPWKEVKLGEIGTISSAGVDKKIVEGEDLVELLNYMDVYKKDFLYKTDTSMTVSAPMRQIKNCNLRKGDIFFTPSSETPDDIAHSAVVMEDIPNGVYSYHIIRLRPTTLIDLKFSAYAFKTAKFYKQAYAWCEGSGQRYVISQDDFRNMKIYIPSNISEQHAIAEVLSTADDEINLLNQKLEATKEQKKGLMQQLLTGQVRVKVN